MIARQLQSAMTTSRRIVSPDGNWESTRLLLKDDAMGFSFHITTIYAGASFEMHYQNHLESVYCISGKGEVTTLDDGQTFPISAGALYVLDKNDRHMLCASEEMTLACVFNPPLNGTEVHNAQGAYELEAAPVSA
jgi:L-ectoine synthase